MLLITIIFSVCLATPSYVFAVPYEYSYYVSLPGHYQSLQVRDGYATTNNNNNNNPNSIQNPQPDDGPIFRRGKTVDEDSDTPNDDRLNIHDEELDPLFNVGPKFGTRIQPLQPRRPEARRGSNSTNVDGDGNKRDREEITTETPCDFCGVDRVNPMDSIDGKDTDPESETVEARNIGGKIDPSFVVPNSVATPANTVVPGYPLKSPFVRYYVLSSL
ncbi:hypothetical protein GWI33_006524 [Rhynchophorus ferrugineus]|uniref:Uncharacterized protein n=1 Tax=Rhynchophorus ferrugineus TaxID=354439 RepID=A0A834MDN6_RHYFE|nr:hypothetical protein GWI33_006524 [Rhynchophorus ferrugineus]